VQAYLRNASVNATGDLAITATATEIINSFVLAGSVAVGGAAGIGLGASGAGAVGQNRIGTNIGAFVEGQGDNGISADSITLQAHDESRIYSAVIGASLAVGVGGLGAALSIGVSLARNEISNEVSAYLDSLTSVTSREGDVLIQAHSLDTGGQSDYESTDLLFDDSLDGTIALETGDKVVVDASHEAGGEVGSVYQYLGQSYNYTTSMGEVALEMGDTVQLLFGYGRGGDAGSLYRYTGGGETLNLGTENYNIGPWEIVTTDLAEEDYTDTSRWLKQATITATSVAVSVGLGAGAIGVGLSGAGAESTNLIHTKTNAFVRNSNLNVSAGAGAGDGNVTIDASSTATLSATIVTVSAALGGGLAGLGVSIGVALARNFVGWAQDPNTPFDFTTADQSDENVSYRLSLTPGDRVKVVDGVRAGDVYEYIGESFSVQHSSDDGDKFVNEGDLVQVDTEYQVGGTPGYIYRYLGASGTVDLSAQDYNENPASGNLWELVGSGRLTDQDYANTGAWKLVNLTKDALAAQSQVRAFIENSSVDAAGDLIITALNAETIDAVVVAGSVAVSVSGLLSASLSGVGAVADNRIASTVHAGIDGDGASGITAESITITAFDTPHIKATVVGVSIAAAFAPVGVGVAVAIGVSISNNQIDNDVAAFIKGADNGATARTGDVIVEAKVLDEPGLQTNRYDTDSGTQELNIGDRVRVESGHTAGGDEGAVYRYLGENGYFDRNGDAYPAMIDYGYSIDLGTEDFTDGSRWLREASITAVSVAVSFGLAIGPLLGIAASGAGAESTNVILTRTNAYIDNSVVVTTGAGSGPDTGNVALRAENTSSIIATVVGAAVAAGIAPIGGGVGISIGVAIARNFIGHDPLDAAAAPAEVQAWIRSSSINASGDLSVIALSNQSINATVVAVSVAVAGGIVGIAGSGAGIGTVNIIKTNVGAFIDGIRTDGGIVANSVSLNAQDASLIKADAVAIAIGFSFAPAGVSVSVAAIEAVNEIGNAVLASILNADNGNGPIVHDTNNNGVEARSGMLSVNAEELSIISAYAVTVALAGGLVSGSGAGTRATNTTTTSTTARVQGSRVKAATGISVTASDRSVIHAELPTVGVSAGLVAATGSVSLTDNIIGSTVDAFISTSTASTAAGNLDVTAKSDITVTADTLTVAVAAGLGGAIGYAQANSTINGHTQAYLGTDADVTVSDGDVTVTATSDATATSTMIGGSGSTIVATTSQFGTATINSPTRAYVGENAQVTANNLTVQTLSLDAMPEAATRTAHSSAVGVAVAIIGVSVVEIRAESTIGAASVTEAYISDGAQLTIAGGAVTVDGQSVNTATAITPEPAVAFNIGFSAAEINTIATVEGGTLAQIDGDVVSADSVTVNARGSNTATATSEAVSVGLVGGGAGMSTTASVTTNADVEAIVTDTSLMSLVNNAVTVDALSVNSATATTPGSAGSVVIAVALLGADASVAAGTKAQMDGDILQASSLTVKAIGTNTARATVVAGSGSVGGAVAVASSQASVTAEAVVEALVGDTAMVTLTTGATGATVTAQSTNVADAPTKALSGAVGLSGNTLTSDATVGGATLARMDGDILSAIQLTVQATGANTATAPITSQTGSVLGSGLGLTTTATVTEFATVEAAIGETAQVTVSNGTTGTVIVNAQSTNIANANVQGGVGAVIVSVGLMSATSSVGGSTTARMDGDVVRAYSLTVGATGANDADATVDGVSVGLIGGGGLGAVASATVTETADVEALVGSTPAMTPVMTSISQGVLVDAMSTNTADAYTPGSAGSIVAAGLDLTTTAIVGGGTTALMDGEILSARSLTVQAVGSNTATATILAQSGAIGGAGAGVRSDATVTADANVESKIGPDAKVTLTTGPTGVTVTAQSTNLATTPVKAFSGAVGVSANTLDAVATVGGGTLAQVDGDILSSMQLTVQATGANTATAPIESQTGSVLGSGLGMTSTATVTEFATVEAAIGEMSQVTVSNGTTGTVLVNAQSTNIANADVKGGVGAVIISAGVMSATSSVGGSTTARMDGDVVRAYSLTV
jgi:hypothetical protein